MREVKSPAKVCSVDGCEGTTWARGWCTKHLQRWRKYGDPLATPKLDVERQRRDREAFFWANVERRGDDECWLWQRKLTAQGYGQMRGVGRSISAHRFAYELLVGPVPEGLVLDHVCRNRACCNPKHLDPCTDAENRARGDTSRPQNGGRRKSA